MDARIVDEAAQLRESIDRALARMNTCIPGIIVSFDPETQTATVQPAVQAKTYIDGESGVASLPQIINAPLIFPFAIGAGFALTLPVSKGDPCVILFGQRSIDNWHDKGGIQPSEEGISSRHHDLTDALVMLAAPPTPNVLGDWDSEGIVLRNTAGSSKVTVYDDSIVVQNATEVIIDTPKTTITGELIVEGLATLLASMDLTGTFTNNGKDSGDTHKHNQPNDSGGNTEAQIQGVV